MLEKRRYAHEHLDAVRRRLMWEPRGHADMYGAIVTEPVAEDSDCGVLFLHNEGFSTMCGHGIIALTKVLVETGMVAGGCEPYDHPHRHAGRAGRGARGARGRQWCGGDLRERAVLRLPARRRGPLCRASARPSATSPSAGRTTRSATASDLGLSLPAVAARSPDRGRPAGQASGAAADVHRRSRRARPGVPLRRHLHRPAGRAGSSQQARVHLRRGGGRPVARRAPA